MSKDSITFRLPCACEHVLEIACSIAVDQGFKITKTDKRGFSAKEAVKWGFTNPVTLHVTFSNERASTRVTVDSSNIGFGPVQSNHVRKRMMDFKEELLDLVNTSSMTFSYGDTYPEEEMETPEGGRLINSNRKVNTHSQQENDVRVGEHPASNQIKYMVYAIGGILALFLIYLSPVIFLLISAIGSVCWVADALGLAKAANWSAIGRLRQKSEQVYWSTGLIFFLVLVISLFFVNIKPSSVKETETVSENTISTHVANTSQPSIAYSNPPRQNVESSPSTILSLDRVISNNVGSEQQTEGIPDSTNQQPTSARKIEDSHSQPATAGGESKNESALKRSAPRPDVEVEIEEFYDEFTTNRIAFDKKYNGKMIGITGEVGQVSDDSPAPSILLKCGTNFILQTLLMPCRLQTSETALAERLEDGDRVRIVGRYNVAAETLFWGDRPQLDACVIAEMPQKDLNAASRDDTSNLGTLASPLTLGQLLNEIDNNEVRAMKKYKGQRIIIKVKWDSVDETMDGAPILEVMDFSIMSMADCILRMNQRDAVANIDLDSEILISAIFEGGSRNWGLKFTDGILNPREDVKLQTSQQTESLPTGISQASGSGSAPALVSQTTKVDDQNSIGNTLSSEKNEGIVNAKPALNVREYPSKDAKVIATIGSGTRIPILGVDASGEWLKVNIPGLGEKWVAKEHVELPDMPIFEAGKQTEVIDPDDKIIANYLLENLPDYMFLNPIDYYDLHENETYRAPWRIKSDFDGNGFKDFAFIAVKKSNYKTSILVLNDFGNSIKHTLLAEDLSFEQSFDLGDHIGLFLGEPGPIEVPADEENFEGSLIQIGTANYPYFSLAVSESDIIFEKYWWEGSRYRSSSDEYKNYGEVVIEDEKLKVTIPTSANVGEGPSIIKVTAQNPTNEERTGTIAFSIDGGKPIVQENTSAYDLFEVGGNNKLLRFSSEGNEWRPLDSTEAISPSMVHVELYDEKWAAGEMKTLSCPVSFTEPGEVLILVRATFSRKSPEGTIVDTNFPVQGHNDEQGLPCALYRVSVTSGVLNPRKDVISQTTEQTDAYAVAETHAASPEEAILGQTTVYFNKLVNKDLDWAMACISDTFEHSEYGSKAKLKAFLEEAKQAGNLDDLRLIMDYAEVKFEGDKAVVYPVDVESSFGSITFELTCTKEGDTWKLTTMDIFGI